jgi:hypothetical protein
MYQEQEKAIGTDAYTLKFKISIFLNYLSDSRLKLTLSLSTNFKFGICHIPMI